MIKPTINMLSSDISHLALHYVWRDSGVTEKHGFNLVVDVCKVSLEPGRPAPSMRERAPLLLDGTYDFLSGLHHETYVYRARGDKRLVYLAQAQNDWDDRVIARPGYRSAKDLEGERFIVCSTSHCVYGNLKHSLELGGARLDRIEFVELPESGLDRGRQIVQALARGEAAAASVDLPFDKQGEKLGLHRMDIPSVPVIHNATMCANRAWVEENMETTTAFLRSMVDAIHFFKTEKSRVCEILERTIAPHLGVESADEVEHFQEGWAALLSAKPYPHPLAVWNVYNLDVAHDPKVNFIGPFEIWDTSYLRTVDDSGYIDELYGSAQQAANPAINPAI
jgi:ABC-type nitrate/sulfonate/bicarbonate transport system substrate-binding protein